MENSSARGNGQAGASGAPCETPNFAKLASGGSKYNRFHTTALCSATRQALLTGRNHHSVGMGGITEIAIAAPGCSPVLPNTKAPLPLAVKLNGYSTAQFGKCNEVPVWQTSHTAHTGRLNGKINWVRIDLDDDAKDAAHYITPSERFRVAMARQ